MSRALAAALPCLFFQAVDDELRTIARQDFLLRRLSLAIVDSLFFLRPLCRQLLIFRRNDRGRRRPGSAVAFRPSGRATPDNRFRLRFSFHLNAVDFHRREFIFRLLFGLRADDDGNAVVLGACLQS
jgi:hypothetical protein